MSLSRASGLEWAVPVPGKEVSIGFRFPGFGVRGLRGLGFECFGVLLVGDHVPRV